MYEYKIFMYVCMDILYSHIFMLYVYLSVGLYIVEVAVKIFKCMYE